MTSSVFRLGELVPRLSRACARAGAWIGGGDSDPLAPRVPAMVADNPTKPSIHFRDSLGRCHRYGGAFSTAGKQSASRCTLPRTKRRGWRVCPREVLAFEATGSKGRSTEAGATPARSTAGAFIRRQIAARVVPCHAAGARVKTTIVEDERCFAFHGRSES